MEPDIKDATNDARAEDGDHNDVEIVVRSESLCQRLGYALYHKSPQGVSLYLGNDLPSWGKILAAFALFYSFLALCFFIFLQLSLSYGLQLLNMYFLVFWFCVIFFLASLFVGGVERSRLQQEAAMREGAADAGQAYD
jgi:hypothetical protein